jgi:thymidylate synthase (FAD)
MKIYSGNEDNLVQYMNHMGTDNTVCDSARVSMDKTADAFTPHQNERLITYLAKHNHWSPFAHCTLQFRFKAPIFVARQLAKHQVGFSWNEVSRRYVNTAPEFWVPDSFRSAAENVKQGSSDTINMFTSSHRLALHNSCRTALQAYNAMLADGVCAEQARAILPQSMMTDWIWTGSLYGWSRMYDLRIDSHSQREVQHYAHLVGAICAKLFPLSWRALSSREL